MGACASVFTLVFVGMGLSKRTDEFLSKIILIRVFTITFCPFDVGSVEMVVLLVVTRDEKNHRPPANREAVPGGRLPPATSDRDT